MKGQLILFFIFLYYTINSQTSWNYIFESNQNELATNTTVLPNNDIVCFVETRLVSGDSYLNIKKLNSNGEIVIEKELNHLPDNAKYLTSHHLLNDSLIITISSIQEANTSDNFVALHSYNYDLELINDTIIYNSNKISELIIRANSCVNHDGNLIAAISSFDFFGVPASSLLHYWEITPDLKIINSYTETFEAPYLFLNNNVIEKWDKSGYITASHICGALDSELNTLSTWCPEYDYTESNTYNLDYWSDSTYIVSHFGEYDILSYRVAVVDDSLKTIEQAEYTDMIEGSIAHPSFSHSGDYLYRDKYYVGGGDLTLGNDRKFFWIAQHNEHLERNWFKAIGVQDVAKYNVLGVTATSDGGVLVSGFIIYPNSPTQGFIYKFDENGELATNTDDLPSDISMITVYPNPSEGLFRIKIESPSKDNYQLRLHDSNGRLVFSQDDLVVGDNAFDFSHLNNGSYYYQLLQEGKDVTAGSWVKM